jgi:CubicO group peptidase (beta-lactamase class C family)
MAAQHARSLFVNPKSAAQVQEKPRSWGKRGLKIGGVFLGLAALLVVGYYAAKAIVLDPVTVYRLETSGSSNINTYKIFPQRPIAPGGSVSTLKQANLPNFPTTITFTFYGTRYSTSLDELFTQTDTQAFIVVRDNQVIYERYLNGTSRDTLHTSFSMAKSITSALIGIAIDEGKIKSINDPLVMYVPELKGRGFDSLTIRDMLVMDTGVAFHPDLPSGLFNGFVNDFVSDDAQQYFTDNLRHLILSVHRSDDPIGADFHYNDYYPLLEGLILQRVTGETVAQFTQDKLWQPMGAEYPASWSLDSTADGFEKTNSAFNARAIDFARIGLVFLNQGYWNGRQILSQQWVLKSTTPDLSDQRPWEDDTAFQQAGGYYKYHWWGLNNPDGTYDYMANGKQGQYIYVSPSTNTVVVRLGGGTMYYPWPFAIRALIHSLP